MVIMNESFEIHSLTENNQVKDNKITHLQNLMNNLVNSPNF